MADRIIRVTHRNSTPGVFGVDCFEPALLERYELVSAKLKVWGVFRGGDSQGNVMDLHEMEPHIFEAIAERQ
jgi:hypothetical protein